MADKKTKNIRKKKTFIPFATKGITTRDDSALQGLPGVSEQGGRCPGLGDRGSRTLHAGTEAEPPRLEAHGETQHKVLKGVGSL